MAWSYLTLLRGRKCANCLDSSQALPSPKPGRPQWACWSARWGLNSWHRQSFTKALFLSPSSLEVWGKSQREGEGSLCLSSVPSLRPQQRNSFPEETSPMDSWGDPLSVPWARAGASFGWVVAWFSTGWSQGVHGHRPILLSWLTATHTSRRGPSLAFQKRV